MVGGDQILERHASRLNPLSSSRLASRFKPRDSGLRLRLNRARSASYKRKRPVPAPESLHPPADERLVSESAQGPDSAARQNFILWHQQFSVRSLNLRQGL